MRIYADRVARGAKRWPKPDETAEASKEVDKNG